MGSISIAVPSSSASAPGVQLGNFRFINIATPARHAIAPGVSLINPDRIGELSEVTMELLEYPDFTTVISTLDNAKDISFTEQKNDVGSGSFTLFSNDSDHLLITPGGNMFVRFRRWGQACIVMACENFHRVGRAVNDSEEVVGHSGPGHAIVLDDAVVYPARGLNVQPREEDRPFDWTASSFDDSGWYSPVVLGTWAVFKAFFAFFNLGMIPGGVDTAADPDTATVSDSTPVLARPFSSLSAALEGDDYFRQWVFITTSFYYTLRSWFDDYGEIYINGQQVLTGDGWTTMQETLIYLTSGWHMFAYHLHNYPGPVLSFTINPEGVAWSLYLAGGIFEADTPVAESNLTAKMVALAPTAPGMTIGSILIICLLEAQARGCFPSLTWTFTAYADSRGEPWPVVNEISTKVGTSYKDFFNEIATTWMDYRFQPGGLVMDAWNKNNMGVNHGQSWVDEDFITALEQEGGG